MHRVILLALLVAVAVGGLETALRSDFRRAADRALERLQGPEAFYRLGVILEAERRYQSFHNTFTARWEDLDIRNPNQLPGRFRYRVEAADASRLLAIAAYEGSRTRYRISMDERGVLTEQAEGGVVVHFPPR